MFEIKNNTNVCHMCVTYICNICTYVHTIMRTYVHMYVRVHLCIPLCMYVCLCLQYSEKDQDILGIIGQVLVPISLVCMVLIILTYTCMR